MAVALGEQQQRGGALAVGQAREGAVDGQALFATIVMDRVMLVAEPDLTNAPFQLPPCQSSQPSPEAPVPRCLEDAFAR